MFGLNILVIVNHGFKTVILWVKMSEKITSLNPNKSNNINIFG